MHPHFDVSLPSPIVISRNDFNKAVFMGVHYEYDRQSNMQIYMADAADVMITAADVICLRPGFQAAPSHSVRCTLSEADSGRLVDLDFTRKGSDFVFFSGRVTDGATKTRIKTASEVCKTLDKIYKTVRGSEDRGWARGLNNENTGEGLLPRSRYDVAGRIKFTSPVAEHKNALPKTMHLNIR